MHWLDTNYFCTPPVCIILGTPKIKLMKCVIEMFNFIHGMVCLEYTFYLIFCGLFFLFFSVHFNENKKIRKALKRLDLWMKLFLPPQKPSEQLEDASRQLYIRNCCLYDRLQSLPLATFPASNFHRVKCSWKAFDCFLHPLFNPQRTGTSWGFSFLFLCYLSLCYFLYFFLQSHFLLADPLNS